MMLKPSQYNHCVPLSKGDVILFNFFTLRLLELDSRQNSMAEQLLKDPNAPDNSSAVKSMRTLLKDNGFLIKSVGSEFETICMARRNAMRPNGSLNLTVIPSLSCNFRCTYCYEKHTHGRFTRQTLNKIVDLVKKRILKNGLLSVTWFGGEPLLCLDIIEHLSKHFITHCDRVGAKYSADIITNGYLLTPTTAKKLRELKINGAQVTLDGVSNQHDLRRIHVSGARTFGKIYNNIKNSSKILPIRLRINVDQENRKEISMLLDKLVADDLQNFVNPYLGRVYPYNDLCSLGASACLADEDFSLLSLEIELELLNKGFRGFKIPRSRNTTCIADTPNGIVITPTGGVTKCWNNGSNPRELTGHLLRPSSHLMEKNYRKWLERDPFSQDCRNCKVLPICMGGCPYIYFKTGKPQCHSWKHHLDESIALYYLIKKKEAEQEISAAFHDLVNRFRQDEELPYHIL